MSGLWHCHQGTPYAWRALRQPLGLGPGLGVELGFGVHAVGLCGAVARRDLGNYELLVCGGAAHALPVTGHAEVVKVGGWTANQRSTHTAT